MKNLFQNKYILVGITLILGLAIGWLIKPSAYQTIDVSDHQHISESNNQQIFTCSMHPQIRMNEPGQCPICGMDLIPLESSDSDLDPMAISMSPTAMQLAHVQTMVVEKGNAEKSIRLTGKVQADERLMYTQSSHIPGRIEKLSVNFTGELVSVGQVIAYIYSPDLVTAQEELFEAQKIKETQPALFNAAKEKLKNWKLTDEQIEKIVASKNTIEQFPILANVSGYVTKKMVNLGDYIKQGEAIYEIADLSNVWILFDVYESDMTWIKKGATVFYTVRSIPSKPFKGIISYIDPIIDPKTRVAKARIEIANKGMLLKPEMFASGTVESRINAKTTSITIPKTAVMWTGKRSVVYVMQNSDQGVSFLMREITLGPELGESYAIESGLHAGEEIAVNGTFSIDAAAQLAGKPSMMNPEGGVAMTGHNHGGSTTTTTSTPPPSNKESQGKANINAETKEALKPLFMDYMKIKDALVNDNLEEAQKAAVLFQNDLGKINMSLFTGDAHQTWMNYSNEIKQVMQHAIHFQDIKEMRKAFQSLSNVMIGLAKSFDPLNEGIYIQHCPMADSNKGANWLSFSEEIKNPYFGAAMLSCGEVTETIK
ncbi:MAG: Cu(I)/Ag(I) efflux system membrane fusion protein [Cyclobacteriaceae bacterium]|jgi:Cu(I)/Ag(I) efflux system membrane fusion protein